MAKAGVTRESARLCQGAKTKRTPKENFSQEGRIDFTEKRNSLFKVQRGGKNNVSADKDEEKKKSPHTAHKKQNQISILFTVLIFSSCSPQICICQRFPFVFAGKHNLILE